VRKAKTDAQRTRLFADYVDRLDGLTPTDPLVETFTAYRDVAHRLLEAARTRDVDTLDRLNPRFKARAVQLRDAGAEHCSS
jgi:hypothetical protein